MIKSAMALAFLVGVGPALAGEPAPATFAPVTTRVGDATIDWTDMRLTLEEQSQPAPGSHAELQVIEQQARGRLGPRVLEAAGQVRLDAETTARDLIDAHTAMGDYLGQESSSWHVSEARYHSSGKVEIVAELDLTDWLRPVAYAGATSEQPPEETRSRFTGVVVDARGLGAEGALAPRLLSAQGTQLYSIERVLEPVAREHTPVQYVSDPADPRAYLRAGDNPLLLRATEVSGRVDLVLNSEDSIRLQTVSRDPYLLPRARVVIVLDP
jgi:hypothetical protein